jgi:hypothetical protein
MIYELLTTAYGANRREVINAGMLATVFCGVLNQLPAGFYYSTICGTLGIDSQGFIRPPRKSFYPFESFPLSHSPHIVREQGRNYLRSTSGLRIGKITAGVAAGQAAAVSRNTGCGN